MLRIGFRQHFERDIFPGKMHRNGGNHLQLTEKSGELKKAKSLVNTESGRAQWSTRLLDSGLQKCNTYNPGGVWVLWKLGSALIKHSHCTHQRLLSVGPKFTTTGCSDWICLCLGPKEMNHFQQLIYFKRITLAFCRISATAWVLLLSLLLLLYGYGIFVYCFMLLWEDSGGISDWLVWHWGGSHSPHFPVNLSGASPHERSTSHTL